MKMTEAATDCRSEDGITVGLIDSLIAIGRVLADRDFTNPAVQEALKDFAQDENQLHIAAEAQDALNREDINAWLADE